MPKVRTAQKPRHDPLHVELTSNGLPQKKKKRTKPVKEEREEEFVDAKTSRRILQIAKEQQDELAEEEEDVDIDEQVNPAIRAFHDDEDEEEDDEDEEEDDQDEQEYEDEMEEVEIDQEDAEALERFFPAAPRVRKTLADMIMEKIEQQNGTNNTAEDMPMPKGIEPRVVEVYTKVGLLLSRYRSGKLPKAFKIIPSLRNWEEILYITRPEEWTPHATYEATRVFVSNLKAKQSQRFFNLVLLEKVRDDIEETKKLNYHLYMALKKALYKPAAFFKGILFPLCEGRVTLRESAIIASVLQKVSIPVLHSSAALLKLAEMDYTGPNSLFIRVLLDKKYALPYKVIDALVFHFIRFKRDPRQMPVLWHQSLLVFAQRYKSDLTDEQKQALMETVSVKMHPGITPEIRREIVNSVARGEALPAEDMDMDLR